MASGTPQHLEPQIAVVNIVSTTLTDVMQGDGTSGGTYIMSITIKATSNTSENMIGFYLDDGTSYLLQEIWIPATAISSSTPAFCRTIYFNNLMLAGTSWKLRVKSGNTDSLNIYVAAQKLVGFST